MNNEPVAYVNSMCNDCIDWKIDPMSIDGQPLYTHPAKTEEFIGGNAICPSCGCKSLYKTARSEWCVTHKCLWQKDYELTLTDEEIMDEWWHETSNGFEIHTDTPLSFARAILRKAQEK